MADLSKSKIESVSTSLTALRDRANHTLARLNASRAAGTGDDSSLKIKRSLAQIAKDSTEMARRAARAIPDNTTAPVHAQMLHASVGLDVSKHGQNISQLHLAAAIEPAAPLQPTDIEGFLVNELQTALLVAVQNAQNNTIEDCNSWMFQEEIKDWKQQKNVIRELLGCGPAVDFDNDASFLNAQAAKAVSSSRNVGVSSGSGLDASMAGYAKVIWQYSQSLAEDSSYPLVENMLEAAKTIKSAEEPWLILRQLTVSDTRSLDAMSLNESFDYFNKQFGRGVTERNKAEVAKTHLKNALRYLEQNYFTYMYSRIYGRTAQPPSIGDRGRIVEEFVALRPDIDSHKAVAAKMYFGIRCGYESAKKSAVDAFSRSRFTGGEIGISRDSDRDPYKRLVCNLLGIYEDIDFPRDVINNADDYLWYRLKLLERRISDDDSKFITEFTALQTDISVTYGESHFEADRQPLRYFKLLILTAQFEEAIDFIRRTDAKLAVHFAIALVHFGMLTQSLSPQAPIFESDEQGSRLNFGVLVQRYVRGFALTDVREAVHYYYLLRNIKESSGVSSFEACVADLALATQAWAFLLGELDTNGVKSRGVIDTFMTSEPERVHLIESVAEMAYERGELYHCIRLLDLAQKPARALELLNGCLSRDINPTDSAEQSQRDNFIELGVHLYRADRYAKSLSLTKERDTLLTLLKLAQFFDVSEKELDHARALEILESLALVPLHGDVETCVIKYESLSTEVKTIIPKVVYRAMTCLHAIHQSTITPLANIGGQAQQREAVRAQSASLVRYTGMLSFRFPSGVNAHIIRLDADMQY